MYASRDTSCLKVQELSAITFQGQKLLYEVGYFFFSIDLVILVVRDYSLP